MTDYVTNQNKVRFPFFPKKVGICQQQQKVRKAYGHFHRLVSQSTSNNTCGDRDGDIDIVKLHLVSETLPNQLIQIRVCTTATKQCASSAQQHPLSEALPCSWLWN